MGDAFPSQILSLSVALGIGLLVGAERERNKALGDSRVSAGIRTFTVVALSGAVAGLISSISILPTALLAIALLISISHLSKVGEGQGLTTELSLLMTFLLGALSNLEMDLAAGLGVILAAVLASRQWLHQFVKRIMSERELHDVITFFAILLVIMPITPNRYFGPFQAINLYEIAKFVVMVIGISALGYILKRVLGPRGGLAMGGFLGGFVSSTTIVMKMGQLSKSNPESTRHAISGVLFSNLSTLIQLHVILFLTVRVPEGWMFKPFSYGLIASLILPWFYVWKKSIPSQEHAGQFKGSAFDLKSSIGFTLLVTGLNLASSALYAWLGPTGVLMTSALAGFTDAHANISSIASLHNKGDITSEQVELSVLLAYSTNAISKILMTIIFGNREFKFHIIGGVMAVVGIVWFGFLLHAI